MGTWHPIRPLRDASQFVFTALTPVTVEATATAVVAAAADNDPERVVILTIAAGADVGIFLAFGAADPEGADVSFLGPGRWEFATRQAISAIRAGSSADVIVYIEISIARGGENS